MKEIKSVIHAHGIDIRLSSSAESDYISLTDIAKYHNPEAPADVIKNWMRIRSTIEFLGLWETLNNPNFKLVEFDQFKKMLVEILLYCLRRNGLILLMPLALFQNLAVMVGLSLIQISLSSSPHGFLLNLNFISSKTTKG